MMREAKDALRISGREHDTEVSALIAAAISDLILTGVHASKAVTTDPLIKRAVITYCKANFGYDDMAELYQRSYVSLKQHLILTPEYTKSGD